MKVTIKENGEVNLLLKEGMEEVKKYLTNNLGDLLDWLDDAENNWDNFTELKDNIKEEIENADSVEDLEKVFAEINEEMSWWGIYFSN